MEDMGESTFKDMIPAIRQKIRLLITFNQAHECG